MDRATLKRNYNVAIALALGVGFALGYTLRSSQLKGLGSEPARNVRDSERDFPGCRQTFTHLRNLFAQGKPVREDYNALLERLDEAVRANPGYVPFAALKAMVWEDRMCNVQLSNYDAKTMAALASSLGLPDNATTPVVADACRARAIKAWLAVESSPLIAQQEKYGERWRALWEQNVNSLRQTQMIRAPIDDGGMADLTRAFNVFALTRDFVRYPNNLSGAREGYSFEEKHIADVIHCPQHREVAFQLPCLPHLTPSRGGTNRADLELFRTAMRITGQKLDVEPRQGSQIHLLAFNTTAQRRLVNAQVRIGYSDGTTQVTSFTVPPWRQDEALARDALARHRLDPVHRDTAIHTCNGAELNFTWSPFYMYHVTIKLDPRRYVDEIYFPVYDPTSAGLEDSAIGDVCIVAMTVTEG